MGVILIDVLNFDFFLLELNKPCEDAGHVQPIIEVGLEHAFEQIFYWFFKMVKRGFVTKVLL